MENHNLMQWCILKNYTQALGVLLDYGCNPTRTGLSGYDLPLPLACCLSRTEIIQSLVEHGASLSETTELSRSTLKYLSQEIDKDRYSKLIDLMRDRNNVTALNIVLKFDDVEMFRLLMREPICSPSISDSSMSSSSSDNLTHALDNSNMKISDNDFDMYHDKLKVSNYVAKIMPLYHEESMEAQQTSPNVHDDLSDYVEQGPFFSLSEIVDGDSMAVNHYHRKQVSCVLSFI